MYRLVHLQLETGKFDNVRSNCRLMSLGKNKALILNGKYKGLTATVITVG